MNEERCMLYPELRHSDDEEERNMYEKARINCRDASFKVLEDYESFRELVKKVLYV